MSNDNKFGSMFDEDELPPPPPAPAKTGAAPSEPVASPVFLNDEARELIDAKAKAAAETTKRAAKARMAAAVKAGSQVLAKADDIRVGSSHSRLALSLGLAALVGLALLGLALRMFLKPAADDTAEPPAPVSGPAIAPAPVHLPAPAPVVEAAPSHVPVAPTSDLPASVQDAEPETMAPMILPQSRMEPTVPAPVAAREEERTASAEPSSIPAAPPLPAKAHKPAPPRLPTPARAPAPTPTPVGSKEQEQIDAIKAFESQLSGQES